MKTLLKNIIIILILTSCQNESRIYNDLRDYPQIEKNKNVDSLIAGIIKTDYVYEKHIGIAGMYPEQYARFERLTELIDQREMLELTKHENPIIRVYAFKGLFLEKSKYLAQAKRNLEKDTTEFRYGEGCLVGSWKISDYIKNPE